MAELKFKATGSSTLSPVDNMNRKEVFVATSFDEQLQFINSHGKFLSNVKYALAMEDGSVVEGITDKLGRTKRIRTNAPVAIKQAKLQPVAAKPTSSSVAKTRAPMAHSCTPFPTSLPDFLTMEINGIKTNSYSVGASVAPVKTPYHGVRRLTNGEIAISMILFGDSIDYTKVRVNHGDYLWLTLQDKDTAITPNGEMYFPKDHFKEDFSVASPRDRHWFIHEMAHVWQYQIGFPVLTRGLIPFGLDYHYILDETKQLRNYNMEAQADLLADYWALLHAKNLGQEVPYMAQNKYANSIDLFEKVLRQFLEDRRSYKNWALH